MTDSTKAIVYPCLALLGLVVGAVLFGWWCGATVGWSLTILGCVIGVVVLVAIPQITYHAMNERRFRSVMLTRACPKCQRPYEAADVGQLDSFMVSTGRPDRGPIVACPACGTKTPWTYAGERWWADVTRQVGRGSLRR